MGLFEDYDELCQTYKAEYGATKTVVLYEVGSFFEIYSVDEGRQGCNVKNVCQLLNIQATRRNKSIQEISPSNPELCGFPTAALAKYAPILVEAGYTVVVTRQEQQQQGQTQHRREVTQVLSRSTYVDDINDINDDKKLACMFCQAAESSAQICCGLAIMDLYTGSSCVTEAWSPEAVETMIGQLLHPGIVEVLIIGDPDCDISSVLLSQDKVLDRRPSQQFSHLAYQMAILRKVYPETGFLTPVEFCGLEFCRLGTVAFVGALDFAHKHDETLVRRLPVPSIAHGQKDDAGAAVMLGPRVFQDLDIVASPSPSSFMSDHGRSKHLLDILNICITPVGRRMFKKNLLEPILDIQGLTRRYDSIDILRENPVDLDNIRKGLSSMSFDLERKWRRIGTSSTLSGFQDVCLICDAFDSIKSSFLDLPSVTAILEKHGVTLITTTIQEFVGAVEAKIDRRQMSLRDGIYSDLDAAREDAAAHVARGKAWLQVLRLKLPPGIQVASCQDDVSMDRLRFTSCFYAYCTSKRFEIIQRVLSPSSIQVLDRSKTTIWFTSAQEEDNIGEYQRAHDTLTRIEAERSTAVLTTFYETLSSHIRNVLMATGLLDVYAATAKNALQCGMCRPTLVAHPSEAFIECKGLRHPIAERNLPTRTLFIPNDVGLMCTNGAGDRQQHAGILLYGVNAAGKSTLSKAVALAALMAQAGLYVPCQSMTLAPFRSIYTRMASRDDIFAGKSTFMVELADLRTIMKHAGPRTLVVGDELCSGTESVSATSIVGAMCLHLIQQRSKFIFATHLHELPALDKINACKAISVYHLDVVYNSKSDALVYNRKLMPGPGRALYGLEVARAMHLSLSFMEDAHAIRRQLLGIQDELVRSHASKYNKKVYVDACGLCGSARAQEVHHILPQCLADEHGLIKMQDGLVVHKNNAANLIPLCSACHVKCHSHLDCSHEDEGGVVKHALLTTR